MLKRNGGDMKLAALMDLCARRRRRRGRRGVDAGEGAADVVDWDACIVARSEVDGHAYDAHLASG